MRTATQKFSSRTAVKKRISAKTATRKTVATKKATAKKSTVKKAIAPLATPKKTAKASAAVQATKTKKTKLVRDSFTIPKNEYVVIDSLKKRAIASGQAVKKSELLRAGIKALAAMSEIQFKAALSNVPPIKTGRPKKSK
ncbi:MAG: hypothetical protein EB125_00570 [Betaproteobacteria bacterium]|nr:hypothetical protein [Betaproteobacteria bacterium]